MRCANNPCAVVNQAQRITHVLNRLTLGARSGDRQLIERDGVEAYIQTQLNPSSLPESDALTQQIQATTPLHEAPVDIYEQYAIGVNDQSIPEEARRAKKQRQRQILKDSIHLRLRRAIDSPRQLQEVMVDFWFNHFSVFAEKGHVLVFVGNYEQRAIRPHALGKFRTLLGATAKHPAMLLYLDNWRNTDPSQAEAQGPFQGLNENYARELLELHTLGLDGGYTQADVEVLTRVLTGWSIVQRRQDDPNADGFKFFPNRHDASDKVLLGEPLAGGGIEEVETALDRLARHPATARHISHKLAQYFVADAPPNRLVDELADRFLATDGDIVAVLTTLFASPEFWEPTHYRRKFKTPYEYVLAIARATNMTASASSEEDLAPLQWAMRLSGMPIYQCRMPDGYPQVESAWLNPDAVMRRVSFAIATANHRDTKPQPEELMATLSESFFRAETLTTINDAPPHLRSASILGSPEMMYR